MMVPAGLATRCTACGTVFRVVPDQLRVSEGWVRCGRCTEVFNASENLVDSETGQSREAPGDDTEPEVQRPVAFRTDDPEPGSDRAQAPAPGGTHVDFDLGREEPAAGRPEPDTEPWAPDPREAAAEEQARLPREPVLTAPTGPIKDHDPPFGPLPGESVAPAATAPPASRLRRHAKAAEAAPAVPSFMRQAERAQRWRRPQVRLLLTALSGLALVALFVQVSVEYRDLIAARFPGSRVALEPVCIALGCAIEPAREINSLAVDSSGLVRVERSNIYRLQVALHNRSAIELALPALDMVLTDGQGQVIARRVLRTAELGATDTTIGPGRELALQATLQATSEPIAGYTIELFYP